jgi:hypothetical protein
LLDEQHLVSTMWKLSKGIGVGKLLLL